MEVSTSEGSNESMKLEDYGCIILAGGKSRRMGKDKALLKINESSFIEILQTELSPLGEKFISSNNEAINHNPSYTVLCDEFIDAGPLSGILRALEVTRKDALFVVACDMPFITIKFVKKLFEEWNKMHSEILVVKDCNDRIHPLCGIYKKSLKYTIRDMLMHNKHRMLDLINNADSAILSLSDLGFDDKIVSNINTPEEYMELQCAIKMQKEEIAFS